MSNSKQEVSTTTDENAIPLRPPRDSFAALQNLVAPLRRIDGKLAVCCWCGFIGNNHAKCQRCRRVFHRPPRAIRPTFKNSFVHQFTNDIQEFEQPPPVEAGVYYTTEPTVGPPPESCVCCPTEGNPQEHHHNYMMAPVAEPEVIDVALLGDHVHIPTPPPCRNSVIDPNIIDLVEPDDNLLIGQNPGPIANAVDLSIANRQQAAAPPIPDEQQACGSSGVRRSIQNPPTISEALQAASLVLSYSTAAPELVNDKEFQEKVCDVMKSLEKIWSDNDA